MAHAAGPDRLDRDGGRGQRGTTLATQAEDRRYAVLEYAGDQGTSIGFDAMLLVMTIVRVAAMPMPMPMVVRPAEQPDGADVHGKAENRDWDGLGETDRHGRK